jgi:hypothetical protein
MPTRSPDESLLDGLAALRDDVARYLASTARLHEELVGMSLGRRRCPGGQDAAVLEFRGPDAEICQEGCAREEDGMDWMVCTDGKVQAHEIAAILDMSGGRLSDDDDITLLPGGELAYAARGPADLPGRLRGLPGIAGVYPAAMFDFGNPHASPEPVCA